MRPIAQTKLALWMVCVDRAGYRRGAQLVEFIDDWRDGVIATGGPLTWDAYLAWTPNLSQRTAYRRMGHFREAFPQLGPHGTPEGLLGPLLARLADELENET